MELDDQNCVHLWGKVDMVMVERSDGSHTELAGRWKMAGVDGSCKEHDQIMDLILRYRAYGEGCKRSTTDEMTTTREAKISTVTPAGTKYNVRFITLQLQNILMSLKQLQRGI